MHRYLFLCFLVLLSPLFYGLPYIESIEEINIRTEVAVIVFGIDTNESKIYSYLVDIRNVSEICYPYEVYYDLDLAIVEAPRWALEELREWYAEHYEDRGIPSWVAEYVEEKNVSLIVRWVNLLEFYEFLWSLVQRIDRELGIEPLDHVVIIGDIDGVSRQYYATLYNPESGRVMVLEGVRGWGGLEGMVFYDLTVIARPRGVGMPLVISTSYRDEPPIWSIEDIEKYVADLVRDHIYVHIVGTCASPVWFAKKVVLEVLIIDFGNRSVVSDILSRIRVDMLRDLCRSYAPWIDFEIEIYTVNCSDIPGMCSVVKKAREVNGSLAIDASYVDYVVAKAFTFPSTRPKGYVYSFRYLFILLATPKPSYLVEDNVPFTAFSTQYYAISSYPGDGASMWIHGISYVVAHELGHALGLKHPFDVVLKVRVLMDWISSVMSYEPNTLAGMGRLPRDYYSRINLAVAHSLALIEYLESKDFVYKGSIQRALELLSEGKILEALYLLIDVASYRPLPTVSRAREAVGLYVR